MAVALSVQDQAKKSAAYSAVDKYVKSTPDRQLIGIGSGSTVVFVAEALGKKMMEEGLDVVCVPTSFQARGLIIENGLILSDLAQLPSLDVCFDGADEVDSELNLIKGGGGCQVLEKCVASASKRLIIVVDPSKISDNLGEKWKRGVPIEVLPDIYQVVMNKIRTLGGEPKLRMAVNKAGPVVTDSGNFIIDADFGIIKPDQVAALDTALTVIPGVVGSGLFPSMANHVVVGHPGGETKFLDRPIGEMNQSSELKAASAFLLSRS